MEKAKLVKTLKICKPFLGELVNAHLDNVDLSKLDLMGITIKESDLSCSIFKWSQFQNAKLTKVYMAYSLFTGANLSFASFVDCDLGNAVIDCVLATWVDFQNSILTSANLSRGTFTRGNFSGCDLRKADLSNANLIGCNLSGANLSGCNLDGANLTHANLSQANLHNANLTKCDMSCANLTGADLTESNLTNACLHGVYIYEVAMFTDAIIDGISTLYIDEDFTVGLVD